MPLEHLIPLGYPSSDSTGLILPTAWPESISQLIMVLDQHFCYVAREEHTRLLAEMATAAAKADEDDQLLNVRQTAELLNIRPQTVYEWIKAGKLKSLIVGSNSIRLKRGSVMAALKAQTQADGRRKYARRGKEASHA